MLGRSMNEKEAIPPARECAGATPGCDAVEEIRVITEKGPVAWFRTRMPRRSEWVIALLISLAAAWFHVFFLLHAGGLWRDEVNTINVAGRHSLGEMANDSFPILMSSIVRGWLALGL